MRIPDHILPDGGWASVQLVQVTLLAMLGLLAWLAARRGGPALRGAILLAALVGVLLTPAVAPLVPVWLPLPHWLGPASAEPAPADNAAEAPPSAPEAPGDFTLLVTPPSVPASADTEGPMNKTEENPRTPVKADVLVLSPPPALEEAVPVPTPARAVQPSVPVAGMLAALWGLGAVVCLSRALLRLVLLYRCALQARPVRDPECTDYLESVARRHGQSVALRESPKIVSPLTLGLCRPVILLPLAWRRWSVEQRRLILDHELAHVQRRDFLAGLVAELAVCLCWFHPLVYWLVARLRLEQEYAADAWVASAAADPKDYVRCLARLALELDRGRGSLAPGFWRRRAEILRRIDMLRRNPRGVPARLEKRAAWTVALLTAAACLAAGGVGRLQSANDPKPADNPSDIQGQGGTDQHGDSLPAGARARLGTTRLRHGAEVTFVAFGPGGKTLLTAGRDNTIRLWDLAGGKEIRRFAAPKPIPPKPPRDEDKGKLKKAEAKVARQIMFGGGNGRGSVRVALSPDGKTLAISHGSTIQLTDVLTGQALRQIQASADGLNPLLFSQDGGNVLSGGFNGMQFSPDGRMLAARSDNDTLFVWATETGKEICKITPVPRKRSDDLVFIVAGGDDGDAPGMAFTPDGKTLAAAATDFKGEEVSHSVKLWDLATGKEVRRIKAPDNVGVVAVAPGGDVVVYSNGATVHVCEVKTGKEVRQIQTVGGRIAALAFTADGKTLAIRTRDQRVGLWDIQTGKERLQLSDAQAVPPAGGTLVIFIAGFSSPETRSLAISPDGKHLAAAAGSTVRLWETATGKEVALSDGHWKAPGVIVVAPDGKTVVSWGGDRVVRRWEAATGKLLGAFPAPAGTTRAAISRDARVVALANSDNTIRLHDAATGKQLHRLEGHPAGTIALAFSRDGKLLASRGAGDGVHLYDVAAGRLLQKTLLRPGRDRGQWKVIVLGGPDGGPQASGPGLAFSPDGKLLVTPGPVGGRDGSSLVLLDVATLKELRKIKLSQPITSVTFSPDGRSLATENADRTITLWEAAGGKKRTTLGTSASDRPQGNASGMSVAVTLAGMEGGRFSEPAGPVGLAFSPDGRALAARGPDGSVRVWDVTAGKEIDKLPGHLGRVETVAFAPNGKTLASGASDTTILLWDAAGPLEKLAPVPSVELPAAEVESLWSDLARDDGEKAFQGVLKLTAAARPTVPFLGERLKPAARIDPRKIDRWIEALESDRYAVRKEAVDSLFKVGEQAVPALRKVLASSPPLETRKRVEELLDRLSGGTLTAEQLRLIRAVEVLERIGTPEAQRVLRALAQGAPGALPTREAEAALDRLGGSPAPRP